MPDSSDTVADPLPDDAVEVGSYPSALEGEEHGLVALAAGFDYWLVPAAESGGYRLLVPARGASLVRRHLEAYARERLRWPPPPIVDPWTKRDVDVVTPLLWSALVLALHRYHAAWIDRAALDGAAIFTRGEWWRVATSLLFHADAAHVISNALGGLLVFTAVLLTFGRLRGWLLLIVASFTANFVVAAANFATTYRSVGASTAIFAGVGLLTGRAIRIVARSKHPHRWRAMFVPFAAGFTVLALYGAGGVRVDVGAHLAGYIAGTLFGFALRPAAQN